MNHNSILTKRLKAKHSKGFSIVEVIIASAILLIIIGGIAYFLSSQKKIVKVVADKTSCESILSSILSTYTSDQPSLYIENYVPQYTDGVGLSDPDLMGKMRILVVQLCKKLMVNGGFLVSS